MSISTADEQYVYNSVMPIQIYYPKYQIGDIVYLQFDVGQLYLKIQGHEMSFGEFEIINGVITPPQILSCIYSGQLILGSYSQHRALIGYIGASMKEIDDNALYIGHKDCDYSLYTTLTPIKEIWDIEAVLRTQAQELLDADGNTRHVRIGE